MRTLGHVGAATATALAAVFCICGVASAQTPSAAPTCTTNTTVVSRGGDVVSSTASTRCEAAAEPATAPPSPACTQTTTVVRRLDVVVSSNTTLKCDEPASSGGGSGGVSRAVLGAPSGAASLLGKVLSSNNKVVTVRNTRGFWRLADARGGVCRLLLTVQADPAGLKVRRTDCTGELAGIGAWTVDGASVMLHGKDGVVVRLTRTGDGFAGVTAAGQPVSMDR